MKTEPGFETPFEAINPVHSQSGSGYMCSCELDFLGNHRLELVHRLKQLSNCMVRTKVLEIVSWRRQRQGSRRRHRLGSRC